MLRRKSRSDRKLFSPEMVNTIIEEVKQRPFIWDADDENYNSRSITASAWEDISKQLDFPETLVRMKWKTVRDTFIREAKRFKIRNVDDYKGKWKYFKKLWFLHKAHEPDDSNVFVVSPEESAMKFERADTSEFEYEAELDPIPVRPNLNETVPPDDDYDLMFLKSLTPYLRQMDPIRKLIIRNKIQDIILNELSSQASSSDYYLNSE